MNPYDKAHELAKALRSSDVFVQLTAAKQRIEEEPSTARMTQDFRRRQWMLQAKQMTGQSVTPEEEESLQKLAQVIELNADVRAYLQAEYQFSVLLSDVERILADVAQDAMLPQPNLGEEIEE